MKERKLSREARAILLTGLARGYFTYDELSRLPDMIGLERYQPRVDDMSKEEIMEEIEKIKDRMRQCQ
ncbi:MAG TPA: hypothetical protein PLL74_02215 [Bacteroidales bacterium]|nr:hypothetical protein [Limnochordia bacterium]HOT55109.1 hypothetical protein [Bacteroidales bacterium]HPM16006.1 hypothetical protein [Bacteroidales bacterium]